MKNQRDFYNLKRQLFVSMPPVFSTIDTKENPKYPFFYMVKLHTWSMKRMDYVEVEKLAYFDGKNWYNTDIYNIENTDWITSWRFAKSDEMF